MSREVMQQALEALEQFIKAELTVGQRYTNAGQGLLDSHAALREELAQPEQEPKFWAPPERDSEYHSHNSETVYRTPMAGWQPLYTAPPAAQPEQLFEPEGRCKECLAYNGHQDGCSKAKPAKPLTDEEIEEIHKRTNWRWGEFARAIEAAHGIKEKT